MSDLAYNPSANNFKGPCTAHSLNLCQRQEIAIKAVGASTPISHIANDYNVSRKFVYEQKDKALNGISTMFEDRSEDDKGVLFNLPITKTWIKQFILALILIARTPYQGVIEILRDLFDYSCSKGNIHNIVYTALEKSKAINRQQNLSQVEVGAHDEIYQAGNPVLAGCCAHSTYCYLLSLEDSCDATAWGVHLLDLKEKQGLNPKHTVADGGFAARKGQQEAWPDTPCHGDVFHALKPFSDLIFYANNRALDAIKLVEELKHKIGKPWGKWKDQGKRLELIQKLALAEEVCNKAITLVDDFTILYKWLKKDILSLVGPSYAERKELFQFIIEQLRLREAAYKHRTEPVRKYLENHSDNLLEFVPKMHEHFQKIAEELHVSLTDVLAVYQMHGLSSSGQKRWELYVELRNRLGAKFFPMESAIEELLENTVRASSLIENLNSRLRNYFTLRRMLGNDYLEILKFFLNHRRFMRSECEERVGKSPTELLTGTGHEHWLELLGFELFKRAA